MRITALIPIKKDSSRLEGKNLLMLRNMPMYVYTIEYAKSSELLNKIVVSTDSDEVISYCDFLGIDVVRRPIHLLGDAPLMAVYEDFYRQCEGNMDFLVGLQPDHPDRTSVLDDILRYVIDNEVDLLVTVGRNYKINGSVKVFSPRVFDPRKFPFRIATWLDDCTNINTREDFVRAVQNIEKLEKRYEKFTCQDFYCR